MVRKKTVYRGTVLEDEKLIASYKEDAIIITTTFLSTSPERSVAEAYAADFIGDKISILCIYNINNTDRRTALDLHDLANFKDEEEILILRYVPFTIKSCKKTHDGRRIIICFEECED
ncbi:unnamed protein product [Rotaria sp. Silwood2]|nr:unnamed protein product [Rotaria sp. Silwood2]CAF4757894.1 unnamed protein product [Rotaria sp. Silwood2]